MTYYDKVETYYKDKEKQFNYFEEKLCKDFGIPKDILVDTIKSYLVQIICYHGKNTYLQKRRSILFSIFLYPIGGLYFFYLSIFGKKSCNVEVDILYEEWNAVGTHFEKFYRPIYNSLIHKKQMIFATINEKDEIFKDDILVLKRNIKFNLEKEISRKIFQKSFTNFFILLNFSIKYQFDFLNLYLRILRSMCKYETESKNIKADFLITAFDNGYNALRYWIYKKNGIKNIISIQNGFRLDMYLYSDFYFSYGKKQITNMYGLKAREIIYSGSFPLFYLFQKYKNINIKYDIVLIEEYANFDFENGYRITTFKKILENFKEFAKRNNKFKIAYRVRKVREIGEDDYYLPIDSLLKDSNIIFESSQSKDSYEAVMKSRVVITYCSSLGFEAIGMNKKVLICNYDNFDFLPNIDSPAVSLDGSYEEFEEKLLYLLNIDYNLMEEYYSKLKLEYMNLQFNPVDKVVEIVNM